MTTIPPTELGIAGGDIQVLHINSYIIKYSRFIAVRMSFLGEEISYLSESEDENDVDEQHQEHDAISAPVADILYSQAGSEFNPAESETTVKVLPQPSLLLSSEENLISEAKMVLGIDFCLDDFQIQALLGKYIY